MKIEMNTMKEHYKMLEAESKATPGGAKKIANRFDQTIWQLPSGRYIPLQVGTLVPVGSIRVATRYHADARWQSLSAEEYDAAQEAARDY